MELAQQKCKPCQVGTPPLTREEAEVLRKGTPEWSLGMNSIEREFNFEDFRAAVGFVNSLAKLAEEEGHHPDIFISYSKVRLELRTHKINGLSKNDFVLAAKIDRIV